MPQSPRDPKHLGPLEVKDRYPNLSLLDREFLFISEHPDFRDLTPYLIGTYATCRPEEVRGRTIESQEAYEHWLECEWCQDHYRKLTAEMRAEDEAKKEKTPH